ncbi:hypothetical protein LMG10661_00691 [Ralstonia syzygii subsp. syzygii]|nr:hypothetical protein LMG10661_00691 [Ralstonia syzygii subsp. syzygii]
MGLLNRLSSWLGERFGQREIQRPGVVSSVDPALVKPINAVPAPAADLARDVVYPDRLPRTFDRIAFELDFLTEDQARALRERADAENRRINDLAIDSELLTAKEVECVIDEQAFVVQVNANRAASPAFLTWVGGLHRLGVIPKVRRVSVQDLVKLREGSDSAPEEIDLNTLNQARQILLDCAAVGGSDLHVLGRAKHTELQVRVKSDLWTITGHQLYADQGERLVRALCQGLATVKPPTINPLDFQDNIQIAGDALPRSDMSSVRIIRGPAYPVEAGGSFLVGRLQYHGIRKYSDAERARAAWQRLGLRTPERPAGEFRLGRMGFDLAQLELLDRLMRRPEGITFISGPVGSGKTTTLYEMVLQYLRLFPGKRVTTIENPIEYPIEEALQWWAESEEFPERLRSALRSDPNLIMPSEIRGVDEAIAALQAAMTGRPVWTTIHVNDPFETFTRLELIDHVRLARGLTCNPNLIAGLIAQRKVPILCTTCCESFTDIKHTVPAYMMRALDSWADGDLSAMRTRGHKHDCPTCHGSGFMSEQAVAEVVVTDEELMRDILATNLIDAARRYRARPESDKTMMEHAMDLVLAGKLDPMEAAKVGEIPMLEVCV